MQLHKSTVKIDAYIHEFILQYSISVVYWLIDWALIAQNIIAHL